MLHVPEQARFICGHGEAMVTLLHWQPAVLNAPDRVWVVCRHASISMHSQIAQATASGHILFLVRHRHTSFGLLKSFVPQNCQYH